MRKLIVVFVVIVSSCSSNKITESEMKTVKLELEKIYEMDQFCAKNASPPQNFSHFSKTQWANYKDSVYSSNSQKAEFYLDQYGYLGKHEVGENGSTIFWLIAQHSDKNINYQKKVLKKLKVAVEQNNAAASNYAYLYDRIQINSNKKQLYATQVTYNKRGQATPQKLEDSLNVDSRRLQYGLITLKVYLNQLTEMHFEMNKANFVNKGITEPQFYK